MKQCIGCKQTKPLEDLLFGVKNGGIMIKRSRYRSKIDSNKNLFIQTYRKNIPWMDGRTPNWINQFVKPKV